MKRLGFTILFILGFIWPPLFFIVVLFIALALISNDD